MFSQLILLCIYLAGVENLNASILLLHKHIAYYVPCMFIHCVPQYVRVRPVYIRMYVCIVCTTCLYNIHG